MYYLEDLRNSVSQYFLNDQHIILRNHTQVKDPFKVQDGPLAFNVTEYKSSLIQL